MNSSFIHDSQCVIGILIATVIFFKITAMLTMHSPDDTVVALAKYRLIERLFTLAETPLRVFFAFLISVLTLLKGGIRMALVVGGLAFTSAIVYGACSTLLQLIFEWAATRYFG
jgi:hypothetical protein